MEKHNDEPNLADNVLKEALRDAKKNITNDKEFIKSITNAKERETICFDERKKNQFDISFGNLQTLRLIPDMMIDEKFRDKLRELTLEFIYEKRIR